MLIDHLAAIFDPMAAIVSPDAFIYYLPRFLGRLAFPIFAFFLAEGCQKTRDLSAYIKRLFLFAIAAQIPFSLAFQTLGGSVILTFFLAAAGISFYQSARAYVPAPVAVLPVLLMAVLAVLSDSDYGWIGVLLVFSLYLCSTKGRKLLVLGIWLTVLYLLIPILQVYQPALFSLLQGENPAVLWQSVVSGLNLWFPFWLPFYLLQTGSAILALIPLHFYSGQRGRGSKYFFYIFYPAHLLIFFIIARCMV